MASVSELDALRTEVERCRLGLELMISQRRTMDRMLLRSLLGWSHSHDLWSHEQRLDIVRACAHGRLPKFLTAFGYQRRSPLRWRYVVSNEYPDVVFPRREQAVDPFEVLQPEVINCIYLHLVVLKRRQAAQRARMTKMMKRHREEEATVQAKRYKFEEEERANRDAEVDDDEWGEWSESGEDEKN